jgi:hypothetical protein
MKKLLLLVLLVAGSSALCGAAGNNEEGNYQTLTKLLLAGSPANIGTCSVTLSSGGNPLSPDAYTLNIWPQDVALPLGFALNSPAATGNRTRTTIDRTKHQILYSESDLAGWVNVLLQLDAADAKVTGLKLFKSFPPYPNGEVYNTGVVCGNIS